MLVKTVKYQHWAVCPKIKIIASANTQCNVCIAVYLLCRKAEMESSKEVGERSILQRFIDPSTGQRAGELSQGSTAEELRGRQGQGGNRSN